MSRGRWVPGPFPGMVLLHHAPGWDEWYREATRKFAHHGYAAISHNLYHRAGEGKADDVAAKVRAEGGVPDAQVIGDTEGAVQWLRAQPWLNGKVGVFGTCSGGRQTFLFACHTKSIDAACRPLGRPRGDEQGGAEPEAAGRADRVHAETCPARCSASSATRTARRPRSRSTSTRPS